MNKKRVSVKQKRETILPIILNLNL